MSCLNSMPRCVCSRTSEHMASESEALLRDVADAHLCSVVPDGRHRSYGGQKTASARHLLRRLPKHLAEDSDDLVQLGVERRCGEFVVAWSTSRSRSSPAAARHVPRRPSRTATFRIWSPRLPSVQDDARDRRLRRRGRVLRSRVPCTTRLCKPGSHARGSARQHPRGDRRMARGGG